MKQFSISVWVFLILSIFSFFLSVSGCSSQPDSEAQVAENKLRDIGFTLHSFGSETGDDWQNSYGKMSRNGAMVVSVYRGDTGKIVRLSICCERSISPMEVFVVIDQLKDISGSEIVKSLLMEDFQMNLRELLEENRQKTVLDMSGTTIITVKNFCGLYEINAYSFFSQALSLP